MDLNLFYSQHQLALFRAGETTSRVTRTRQCAAAALIAYRIATYQRQMGATAAAGWLRRMESADSPARMEQGQTT